MDYDEEEDDEDRRERTSRYTSEKKGSRKDSVEGDENKKENGQDEVKNARLLKFIYYTDVKYSDFCAKNTVPGLEATLFC